MENSLKELNLEQLEKVSGGEVDMKAYIALMAYVEELKQKYNCQAWELQNYVTKEEQKKLYKMYEAAYK